MASVPLSFPDSQAEIQRRRSQILSALCAQDAEFARIPVKSVSPDTLRLMLRLYDDLFLSGMLEQHYANIRVTLSSRLLSAAGKFILTKSSAGKTANAEIRMSSDFLFRLTNGSYQLNGLTAHTPQEAFLFVFEHELCHAVEAALYGGTGHSKRFMTLASGLFGHTTATHSLPTRKAEAAQQGIRVGMRAGFSYQGKSLTGIVTYVGKTATVMVPSAAGEYRNRFGKRFSKCHVPLSQLKTR